MREEDIKIAKEELARYGYLRKKINIKKKKKINLYQVNTGKFLITWGKNNTQKKLKDKNYYLKKKII